MDNKNLLLVPAKLEPDPNLELEYISGLPQGDQNIQMGSQFKAEFADASGQIDEHHEVNILNILSSVSYRI